MKALAVRFGGITLVLLTIALQWWGCAEEEIAENPPAPPSNLQALSVNDSTVRLKWTASPSESSPDFGFYHLSVYEDATSRLVGTIRLGTRTPVDITGLRTGVIYRFELRSSWRDTTRSDARSTTAAVVRWSPATRYTTLPDGSPIRLYETASRFPSGLDLEGPDGKPRTLTVAQGNEWDLCLDTRPVQGRESWDIGSPGKSSYDITSPRRTLIDTLRIKQQRYLTVDSLNQIFETEAFGGVGMAEVLFNFNNQRRGFIVVLRTQDGNWAKVFVKADAQGNVLQGTSPNRYVELEVSYQKTPNVPYALPRAWEPSGTDGFVPTIHIRTQKKEAVD
ncbi:MAG: fibronectin type III domain-containing protein [Candidatus Kapabacteria bacterium]|nr:fibronectin type III domain-containing protein [Candidatus Kapabacteria bacterium]MDW8012919.1 fibronectin type III domain-containing protein [Bacteroidota bacterium]